MGTVMGLDVIRAKCVACDTAKNIPTLHLIHDYFIDYFLSIIYITLNMVLTV